MLNTISALALHEQLVLSFLFGSLALCFVTAIGGWFVRRIRRNNILPQVPLFPMEGIPFPSGFDYAYTIIFAFGFSLSIASVFFMTGPESGTTDASWLNLATSLGLQTSLYLPFIVRFYMLPERPGAIKNFCRLIPRCALCLIAIGVPALLFELLGGLEWVMNITQCPQQQEIVESFMEGSLGEKVVIAFAAVIVAPITEECCFRGFIYNILKHHASRWLAILASSLFFGAIHGSIAQLLPLTIFAIVQCIAYDKSRTLRLPIMVHASFNTLSLLFILLFE